MNVNGIVPQQQRQVIAASNLRKGATLVDRKRGDYHLKVLRVVECADGSIRVFTDHGEQRMTRCVQVWVLH